MLPLNYVLFTSSVRKLIFVGCLSLLLFELGACRRKSDVAKEATITLYGFSVIKEPLDKEIFPAYQKDWYEKTGQRLSFSPSYAGSEIVTNQIVSGAEADIAILATELNADRLVNEKATRHVWRNLPFGGIVNKTPMVILVRQGNPKQIRDFSDLGKPGLKLIHCDPASSGAGQWSLLAVYGSELIKSSAAGGVRDEKKALETLQRVWKNVIATPGSAREGRTQFERREGDAFITYELDALQLMKNKPGFEMVIPPATIFSEHPVVIINHGMPPAKYAIVELFARSLWDRSSQEAWVRADLHAVIDEKLNEKFARIQMPFYVKNLGGWPRAYKEIIEGAWKGKVQLAK